MVWVLGASLMKLMGLKLVGVGGQVYRYGFDNMK
jgi:hypothetical protein